MRSDRRKERRWQERIERGRGESVRSIELSQQWIAHTHTHMYYSMHTRMLVRVAHLLQKEKRQSNAY